jgi:hypothetical protein
MPVGVGIAVCPCQSLNAIPGQYQLVINKRKGFIKLAMRAGARLVPVIRCVLPDPSRLTEEWFWMMLRTVAMSVVARCGGVECPVTDGDVLVPLVSCVCGMADRYVGATHLTGPSISRVSPALGR